MKNDSVGPDTYDADKGFDKNNSPAYSMGNRRRSANSKYLDLFICIDNYLHWTSAFEISFSDSSDTHHGSLL